MEHFESLQAEAGGVSAPVPASAEAPVQRILTRPLLDLSTLDSEQPPAEMAHDFVLPFLDRGECGVMTGESGVGKSRLTLQMAVSVAIARDLTQTDVCPDGLGIHGCGPVVFLELEDSQKVVWPYLRALYKQMSSKEQGLLKERLEVYVSPGKPLDVRSRPGRAELRAMAEGRRLVVLGPLSGLHAGDENETAHMRAVAEAFTEVAVETGASILVLHHASKAAIQNGQLDTRLSSRGATSFTTAMRMHCALVGMTDAEARAGKIPVRDASSYVRWCVPTQHHGPRPAPIWLQMDAGGFHAVRLKQSAVAKTSGTAKRKGVPPKAVKEFEEDDGSW